MKKKELPIFEVSASFVYRTPEGMRERSLHILFRSVQKRAIFHALRWAKNREGSMNDGEPKTYTLGCVKVHLYGIGEPEFTGYIRSGPILFPIYEWKYDRGTTFEQELEQARRAAG